MRSHAASGRGRIYRNAARDPAERLREAWRADAPHAWVAEELARLAPGAAAVVVRWPEPGGPALTDVAGACDTRREPVELAHHDGSRLVARTSLLRSPRDPAGAGSDAALLEAMSPSLRQTLLALDLVGEPPARRAGVKQMLDAFAEVAFVLTEGRAIAYGNRAARLAFARRPPWMGDANLAEHGRITSFEIDGRPATLLLPFMPRAPARLARCPSLRRVGDLVARGLADKEVAAELDMPLATVRTYVTRLYRRAGVTNRVQFAIAWSDPPGAPTSTLI